MKDEVSITLIANAGVLVKYREIRFLIDGLYYDNGYGFSNIPKQLLKQMITGKDEFKNIDYLIFTHNHQDHFSAEYTMEYLKNNDIACIFMPIDKSNAIIELQNYLTDSYINYRFLKIPIGDSYCYKLNEYISITIFNASHMGEQYSSVENYCFLLSLGTKNILFTADADHVLSNFENPLAGIDVDTVFVNPLFFNNKAGRNVIEKVIRPNKVVIYHIPFPEDGKLRLRKIVERDMIRYKSDFYDMLALWDIGQSILI
jgi:L-ascorbate metabolism protein UlaG (beta-lactamase superfamily)